jgi:large subunit ribosomal protein L17
MRHRKAKVTLDRNSAQRQRLLRGLAMSLILHERIITTPAKARATRSLVERMISIGKINDVHHRRQILRRLPQPEIVKKLLETLGPRFKTRPGGYTRMTKLSRRQGDGAEQVVLEVLSE